MSTNLPLRTLRIPAFQRQCLFLCRQRLRDYTLAATSSRTFSTTTCNAYRKKSGPSMKQDKAQTQAAAQQQIGPSPKVNFDKAQRDEGAMAEDIGLLQNTIVRAPFRDLPSFTSWQFWSYFWALVKSKGTALYARSAYRRCIQKSGWKQWLPVDAFNNTQLKHRAEKLYIQLYKIFAQGDIKPLQEICLPPLVQKFKTRIAARGPRSRMEWNLHKFKSVRVVSHRASPLGEDHPDTAYRQAIFRIESVQSLSMSGQTSRISSRQGSRSIKKLRWVPEEAQQKQVQAVQEEEGGYHAVEFVDNETPTTVVEYLVLQKRVIRGKEEDWKVWGFAEESTPARIEDDEAYWRKTLAIQTAGGEQ